MHHNHCDAFDFCNRKMRHLVIFCFQVLHAPENHTADNIRSMIYDVLDEWGLLESKMTGISTDNAASNIKACKDAG